MTSFQSADTTLPGLIRITPFYAGDRRGWFMKSFEKGIFKEYGISCAPFEAFYTQSCKGVLRGLHFQRRHSQDKLVRVLAGEVFDVAVDLRPRSPTFGKWQGFRLSAENRHMLYIPKEFAHGFLVLSNEAVVHYLCGDQYDPSSEDGILWNDPELSIDWPLEKGTVPDLSNRDRAFQSFAAFRRSIGQE